MSIARIATTSTLRLGYTCRLMPRAHLALRSHSTDLALSRCPGGGQPGSGVPSGGQGELELHPWARGIWAGGEEMRWAAVQSQL